jgi:3-deoxy-D-manno-octulosonic-acid transferase
MSPHDARPAMHFLYSLLFTLGVIVTAPYYLWRLRGSLTSVSDWRERFGFLPGRFQQGERGAIWVHAVSVGETLAIAGLVRELERRYPERKIFVSHVTTAGREAGESRLPAVAGRFLLPLDWSVCVRRVLRRIRPALLVVVETELWPNLICQARLFGTRVVLVNGRISDRSFPRYRWVRPFMRRVLADLDCVCAQSEVDAGRFCSLGAAKDRVVVSGNLKFDAQPPQLGDFAPRLGQALADAERAPIVVAASTMPGEEKLLLPAWEAVRRQHPRALLILAPRHPARFEEVAALFVASNLTFIRRTSLASEPRQLISQIAPADILLLDTIGELAGIFELADAVFMGGSLVPTGGHNLLEPAYWGKAIFFGPHMHNFRDIAQLFLQNDAAVQVSDAGELARALLELLSSPERRQRLGQAARKVLDEQRGATERVLQILAERLDSAIPPSPATERATW